jgi:ribulose-phosphate 3-epimerase
MDGHFVPNLTIGPGVTEAVRRATDLPVDVHLMIENPERYVDAFAQAGASYITVHQETCPHLHRTLQQIREAGALPGVALNPSTPVSVVEDVVADLALLLIMSVNPGFGGQSYIARSTERVGVARALLDRAGAPDAELQVDGGVDARTTPEVVAAGATVLVAGSAVYGHAEGVHAGIRAIRQAAASVGDPARP